MLYDDLLQGYTLSVFLQIHNHKSPLSVVYVHVIEGGVYCFEFPVRNMVYHGKLIFSSKGQE